MSNREVRFTPHYLTAGVSNKRIVNGTCIARLLVTADGAGGAVLMIYDSATASSFNTTLDKRAVLRAKVGESFQLSTTLQFGTGMIASLSGTGAVATIMVRQIR